MPNQRPFFLTNIFSAFRQQQQQQQQQRQQQQQNKPTTTYATPPSSGQRATLSSLTAAAVASSSQQASRSTTQPSAQTSRPPGQQLSRSIPISVPLSGTNRRRGSDCSTEGFRDTTGTDRWYIGGRTAQGEEKYFKLGVMRRVRSNDGLSLDRLSL